MVWSIPIGAMLGLLLMLQIKPRGDRLIIGAICGAIFPLALRRIWLVLAGVLFGGLAVFGEWGIVSSIISICLIIAGIVAIIYVFFYSWIALVLELGLYLEKRR